MQKLTSEQKWNLWALRNAEKQELINASIRRRWVLPNWDIEFPWWRDPAPVRILIYAEGRNITFHSQLKYVTTLLQSRPYFYVHFKITTAHRNFRGTGASIDGPRRLDDPELDILNNFDEIWFFGFGDKPDLEQAELVLLEKFMNVKFGGVLVTGDHECRGKSIAGQIPRAGKMRLYPAPKARRPEWNNSLEEGPDPNKIFDANDQADDCPQIIAYQHFAVKSLPGFKHVYRPHPVLCGAEGPIDVLPDHQHEGEAIAPQIKENDNEWPKKNNHQEYPVVIAVGKTKEPDAGNRSFGVLSAYDGHSVDVGRIIADSSWHHWFDRNLTGIPESSIYLGFDDSPAGKKVLKKIDTFFLNCGVWLAPPAKQREMCLAAWWSILFSDDIAELSPDEPLWSLGEQAISALTQYASICAASDWIFGLVPEHQLANADFERLSEYCMQLNVSLEQHLAGGILRSLMTRLSSTNPRAALPLQAPSDEELEKVIKEGIREALDVRVL